ncbi:MAG: FUN14 domain-containing protein [Phycisphaerales bacterium]
MTDGTQTSGAARPRMAARAGGAVHHAWRGLPTWRRLAAVLSIVVTVVGGGVAVATGVLGGGDPTGAVPTAPIDDAPAADGILPGAPMGLIEIPGRATELPTAGAENDGGDGTNASGLDRYSPAIFRTGFSFFVGFAIAFAVRSFVKISIAAIGFVGLALFGLQYAGLIDVQWDAIASRWDDIGAWLRPQLESFHTFITGALPSATAASAGLFTGFKKG